MTVQTGQEDKPFHLLLTGQHITQMAMLLLEFSYKTGIPLPSMPGAKTGWQTALAQDGSRFNFACFKQAACKLILK